MKLLRVSFDNVKMFEDGNFTLDFYAQDKVFPYDESVTLLRKPFYKSNVVAIAGINASGKSVALSLVDLALRVVEGEPVVSNEVNRSLMTLFTGNTTLRVLVWSKGEFLLLGSKILNQSASFASDDAAEHLIFDEEVLYRIEAKRLTKAMLSESFDALASKAIPVLRRSELREEERRFLQKDISIMSAYAKGGDSHLLLQSAGFRLDLRQSFIGLNETLRAFDSSIEYLTVEDGGRAYRLKLKGSAEPLILSRDGLDDVLSTGTSKGLAVVQHAVTILRSGGFLLLDEIENHLNRQLVNVIIDLFTTADTNPNGATLLFTTHYPEVLDHLHRKDNVYFFAKNSDALTSIVKYSSKVKRVENKKSEVFISNFVRGTAPRFSEVSALRSYAAAAIRGRDAG